MQLYHMEPESYMDVPDYAYVLYKKNDQCMFRININTFSIRHIFLSSEYSVSNNAHFSPNVGVEIKNILDAIDNVDASEPCECVASELLCELAQAFSSFGKRIVFDVEKTQMFVKPAALALWLQIAKVVLIDQRESYMRTSKECADSISKDPFGFSLCQAGQRNGEVKGRGIYLSL